MSEAGQRRPGWISGWVARSYERFGLRGSAVVAVLAVAAFALPWNISTQALESYTAGARAGQWTAQLSVSAGLATLALASAVVWIVIDIRRVERWQRAGWTVDTARQTLQLILTAPSRWTILGLGGFYVVYLPLFLWWYYESSGSMVISVAITVGTLLASAAVLWPVAVYMIELGARPLVTELWAAFPELPTPPVGPRSLRTRIWLPIPMLTMSAGFLGAQIGGMFDDRIVQVAAVLGAAVLLSVFFALVLRFAANEVVLRAVDDLTDGVLRVTAGSSDTKVPVTTADEFGVLSRSFNQLTERLAAQAVETREARARIVVAGDEARRRIERDLHDGAQQYLVLLSLKLGILQRAAGPGSSVGNAVRAVQDDLKHALADLRAVAHGLYPAVLESGGLDAALEDAAEHATIPVDVGTRIGPVRPDMAAAIYFCCLEAIENAAAHAGQGASVGVTVRSFANGLWFSVADDGRGYDTSAVGIGSGQQTMADRVGALGGELTIESIPGRGTTVSGTIPLEGS